MTSSCLNERYVSAAAILSMLKSFRLRDLVEVAANPKNIKFEEWKRKADQDVAPVISPNLIEAIENYCRNQSLFLSLSDEAVPFLDSMP
jgi:hypothetical protein